MRKLLSLLLVLLCLPMLGAADGDAWICTNCEKEITGNFCSECGVKRPATGEFVLTLDVEMEKNAIFSTYDVNIYLDGALVGSIPHGESYRGVLPVNAGEHEILFCKDGDRKISGTVLVGVSKNTEVVCEISAHNDEVAIDELYTDGDPVDTRIRVGEPAEIDGVTVTLLSVKESKGSTYNKPEKGNVYVLCEFEIANGSDKEINISSLLNFEAYCDDYKYGTSFSAIIECSNQLDGSVDAGRKMKGQTGFEVPKGWEEMEIKYIHSIWGDENLLFVISRDELK